MRTSKNHGAGWHPGTKEVENHVKPNDKENVQSEIRKVGSVEQDMFKNKKQMEMEQGWVRSQVNRN